MSSCLFVSLQRTQTRVGLGGPLKPAALVWTTGLHAEQDVCAFRSAINKILQKLPAVGTDATDLAGQLRVGCSENSWRRTSDWISSCITVVRMLDVWNRSNTHVCVGARSRLVSTEASTGLVRLSCHHLQAMPSCITISLHCPAHGNRP